MATIARRHGPPAALLVAAALPWVLLYALVHGRMVMVPAIVHLVAVTTAGTLAALAAVAH